MSDQDDNNQFAQTAEDNACHAATYLLMDALDAVPGFVPARVDGKLSEAILTAAHALIAKLDSMETNYLEAFRNLCVSLGSSACTKGETVEQMDTRKLIAYLEKMEASQPEVMIELRKHRGEVLPPTEHESELMYRALEADYLANNKPALIEEMDAALCRFKTLSGY